MFPVPKLEFRTYIILDTRIHVGKHEKGVSQYYYTLLAMKMMRLWAAAAAICAVATVAAEGDEKYTSHVKCETTVGGAQEKKPTFFSMRHRKRPSDRPHCCCCWVPRLRARDAAVVGPARL